MTLKLLVVVAVLASLGACGDNDTPPDPLALGQQAGGPSVRG